MAYLQEFYTVRVLLGSIAAVQAACVACCHHVLPAQVTALNITVLHCLLCVHADGARQVL